MTEIKTDLESAEMPSAKTKRARSTWMIASAAVIGAAVLAGIFLIPRGDIVERQLDREVAQANQSGTTPVVVQEDSGSAQVLAGPNGTTFIIGNPGTLIGINQSVRELVNAKDPNAFEGTILVRSAEVQSVPGDKVFAIGDTESESILVKIEEPTSPGPSPEHVLVVRPGQKVSVSGSVAKLPTLSSWGINGFEAGKLGNTSLYIRANTVQIMPD